MSKKPKQDLPFLKKKEPEKDLDNDKAPGKKSEAFPFQKGQKGGKKK